MSQDARSPARRMAGRGFVGGLGALPGQDSQLQLFRALPVGCEAHSLAALASDGQPQRHLRRPSRRVADVVDPGPPIEDRFALLWGFFPRVGELLPSGGVVVLLWSWRAQQEQARSRTSTGPSASEGERMVSPAQGAWRAGGARQQCPCQCRGHGSATDRTSVRGGADASGVDRLHPSGVDGIADRNRPRAVKIGGEAPPEASQAPAPG